MADKLLPPRKMGEGKKGLQGASSCLQLRYIVLLKGQAGRAEEGHGVVYGLVRWWTIMMAKPKGQEEIASVCVTSP